MTEAEGIAKELQSEVIRVKGRTARENANKMLLMCLNAIPVRRDGWQ